MLQWVRSTGCSILGERASSRSLNKQETRFTMCNNNLQLIVNVTVNEVIVRNELCAVSRISYHKSNKLMARQNRHHIPNIASQENCYPQCLLFLLLFVSFLCCYDIFMSCVAVVVGARKKTEEKNKNREVLLL